MLFSWSGLTFIYSTFVHIVDKLPPNYEMPRDEVKNRLTRWFERVDTDKNGKLNWQEAKNWLQTSMINIEAMKNRCIFDKIDFEKDGKLTWNEYLSSSCVYDEAICSFGSEEAELIKAEFKLADINHDEVLNPIEFAYLTNPVFLPELLDFEIDGLYTALDVDKELIKAEFKLADINHDEVLNPIEFAYLTNPVFLPELLDFEIDGLYTALDVDKNKRISFEEFFYIHKFILLELGKAQFMAPDPIAIFRVIVSTGIPIFYFMEVFKEVLVNLLRRRISRKFSLLWAITF
eukprot:GHVP01002510.1.p1 GENE.GHVP01002510.1~~GHVP01002510.1.p1  ORF type:complete len:290 (+),score=51.96 GHVP01002510.1:586-1455(+)